MSWQKQIRQKVKNEEWNKLMNIFEEKVPLIHKLDNVIVEYYLPLYCWIKDKLNRKHQELTSRNTLIVGISCPQGGGKSFLVNYLKAVFEEERLSCGILSLDDLYFKYEDQIHIAQKNYMNKLLEYRGNPGTHDTELGIQILENIKSHKEVFLPRYDKSAHRGRGDRCSQDKWIYRKEPYDLILFEGWCLGFEAVDETKLITEDLRPVNNALKYYKQLFDLIDVFILMEIDDIQWIYKWREEAELKARKLSLRNSLTKEQVKDFVDRFIKTYQQYLPQLYKNNKKEDKNKLIIQLDKNRHPKFF